MKNFKINFESFLRKSKKRLKLMIPSSLRKAECELKHYHAHKYINKYNYVRFIDSERLSVDGYKRCDSFIVLYEQDRDLFNFMRKHRLLRIKDNIKELEKDTKDEDYYEYEYSYTTTNMIPVTISDGKTSTTTYTFVTDTCYGWTKDPNHRNLTGDTRKCHWIYTSYKIEERKPGKYRLVENPDHEDILATKDEYPYIKEKFWGIKYLEDDRVLTEEPEERSLSK